MKNIRAFVYLDKHKMYSISSQIFEGLTEYIVDYTYDQNVDVQGAKSSDGMILGHILGKELGAESKRFLHDYSYSVFESKLCDDNQVLDLDCYNISTQLVKIPDYNFVRITGKAVFNDMRLMVQTMESFNDMGKALTYISTQSSSLQQDKQDGSAARNVEDRSRRSTSKARSKKTTDKDIESIAIEMGLYLDPEFLKKMSFLLKYGYKDQLELQIPMAFADQEKRNVFFSAVLKRKDLEEDEETLIKKYARNTEKEFTMFGMVTQSETVSDEEVVELEPSGLKQALMNLNSRISAIEDSYIGKLSNEIIVDPIAIYREL